MWAVTIDSISTTAGEIPAAKKLQTIVVIGVRSAMRRGDGVFFSRLPQSREQIFCLLSWHRTSMSAYRYSCLSKQQCKRCILAYLVPRYSFWAWQVACKSLFHPSYFGFLLVLPVGISGHCSFTRTSPPRPITMSSLPHRPRNCIRRRCCHLFSIAPSQTQTQTAPSIPQVVFPISWQKIRSKEK